MSSDEIEKFFKDARKISLDSQKKDAIGEELVLFMKKNPLSPPRKPWLATYAAMLFKATPVRFAFAAFLLLIIGGGVVSAANYSLPGEVFYPVKIGFNEKAKEILAFSDEAKIQLNVQLAELRLQEAETLSIQNKISEETALGLQNNFNEHTLKASKLINNSYSQETNDKNSLQVEAEKTVTNFEASLRAHKHILDKLEEKKSQKTLDGLILHVDQTVSDLSNDRVNLNATILNNTHSKNIGKDGIVKEKLSTVENSINRIKKIMKNKKSSLDSDTVLQSEANLHLIEEKISEGKKKIEDNKDDYEGLISSLQEANVIAKESQELLNQKTKLKTDIPIRIENGKY